MLVLLVKVSQDLEQAGFGDLGPLRTVKHVLLAHLNIFLLQVLPLLLHSLYDYVFLLISIWQLLLLATRTRSIIQARFMEFLHHTREELGAVLEFVD